MATERYVALSTLQELLNTYKSDSVWNLSVIDSETKNRVIDCLLNEMSHIETIGSRQLSNKLLKAKQMAIDVNIEIFERHISDYKKSERVMESKNNIMLMGFYRGMRTQAEETVNALKQLAGG